MTPLVRFKLPRIGGPGGAGHVQSRIADDHIRAVGNRTAAQRQHPPENNGVAGITISAAQLKVPLPFCVNEPLPEMAVDTRLVMVWLKTNAPLLAIRAGGQTAIGIVVADLHRRAAGNGQTAGNRAVGLIKNHRAAVDIDAAAETVAAFRQRRDAPPDLIKPTGPPTLLVPANL